MDKYEEIRKRKFKEAMEQTNGEWEKILIRARNCTITNRLVTMYYTEERKLFEVMCLAVNLLSKTLEEAHETILYQEIQKPTTVIMVKNSQEEIRKRKSARGN